MIRGPRPVVQRRRIFLIVALAGIALAAVALASAPPSATIGSSLRGAIGSGNTYCGGSPSCTLVERSINGVPVRAPFGGTVTKWQVRAGHGVVWLQVVHRKGDETYKVTAQSHREEMTGGIQSFTASLPIRKHDLVGVRFGLESTLSAGPRSRCLVGFVPALSPGEAGTPDPGYTSCAKAVEVFYNAKIVKRFAHR